MQAKRFDSSAPSPSAEFDEDGFLTAPERWNEGMAEHLAAAADIGPLGEHHWVLIHAIRDRYMNRGDFPLMRRFCRVLGLRADAVKGLFGGCSNLWRIAGLPHPGAEAKSHMD